MWRLKQWAKRFRQYLYEQRNAIGASIVAYKWAGQVRKMPHGADGRILLHIGCGDIDSPGFINIDARPKPHVHIVTTNLFKLNMIPDGVADMIYMSHVLEHVSHRMIVATLREMRRVLKDGGVLRVSVPDFDKIIDIYRANQCDIVAIEQPLMGGQDYPFNYHYAIFNHAHLCKLMLQSEFRETRTWDPDECECHDFDDWASRNIVFNGREFPISLNIEAIK